MNCGDTLEMWHAGLLGFFLGAAIVILIMGWLMQSNFTPMTPQKRFEFAALCYRTALASKRENPADTRIEDVYEVFERCGVVVTNLAALEALREGK